MEQLPATPNEVDKPSPLDRQLQRELLFLMRGAYPERLYRLPDMPGIEERTIFANLIYLEEHGLCDAGTSLALDGHISWGGSKITARGLDFVEDDGGLSAVLRVITVKLHADSLRELLAARIEAAPITREEKTTLKSRVAQLSQTGLTTVVEELVKAGLQYAPNVAELLRTLAVLLDRRPT